MPKNFYNLPPSWNPGYAIPPSVMDEGLERRAFVTAELPRGTYDNPRVGNGGYAVPQYVDEEGYGRGTFTTSWLPRGFVGPQVPHWLDQQFAKITGQASLGRGKGVVMAMQTPMGDTAVPYSSSGANLGMFGTFGKRAAAALITNAKRFPPAKRAAALKQMMDRIDPSLHARAGRMAAKAQAQGAAPAAALAHGLAAAMTEGMLTELHKSGKSRTAPQRRSLLGLGCYGCAAALGADAFTATNMNMQPGMTVHVNATPDGTAVAHQALSQSAQLAVGPFSFGLEQTSIAFSVKTLTPVQLAFLQDGVKRAVAGNPSAALGVATGRYPIVKFRFPVVAGNANSGKMFGIFYKKTGSPYALETADNVTLTWKEYVPGDGIFQSIWNAIKEVVAVIVDVVKEAIDIVGDLACGTVTAPGAAGAAATASGGAAAVGVAIAGGICGGQQTGVPPPMPASSSPMLPLAILGGGALLIIALNKKKKASSP